MIDDSTLAKTPRKVDLITVRDGHVKSFIDDGASITPDGAFPHGLRQNLLFALGKVHAQGKKDGPRINSFVLAGPIEIGRTNNGKVDPAIAGRKLTDIAYEGKTYADVIAENKARIVAAEKEERKQLSANARRAFGLTEDQANALDEIVANRAKAASESNDSKKAKA